MNSYPADCKERAVKRAVAAAQPMAQTARDRGVTENTVQPWMGTYPRATRQAKAVHDEPLDEELQRLRKANGR